MSQKTGNTTVLKLFAVVLNAVSPGGMFKYLFFCFEIFSCPCMSISKTAEMLGLDGNRAFCCAFWGNAFTLGNILNSSFS